MIKKSPLNQINILIRLYVYDGYSLIIARIYKIDIGICLNKEKAAPIWCSAAICKSYVLTIIVGDVFLFKNVIEIHFAFLVFL